MQKTTCNQNKRDLFLSVEFIEFITDKKDCSREVLLDFILNHSSTKNLLQKKCVVTGVNIHFIEIEGIKKFVVQDLENPISLPEDEKFDYIILADVLEHLRNAQYLLSECKKYLAQEGKIILSTGNIALWVMRLSLLFGKFNYGRRGILDETHVRLYTLNSFVSSIKQAGLSIVSIKGSSIPFELLFPQHSKSGYVQGITWIYSKFVNLWKSMFAYQFIIVAENLTNTQEEILKIEDFKN